MRPRTALPRSSFAPLAAVPARAERTADLPSRRVPGKAALALLATALAAAPGAAQEVARATPPAAEAAPDVLRFARVAGEGARVLNLPDEQANEVARLARGALLAVRREAGDWLEVEVPGGFAVWVSGRYLRPSADEPDVVEVTGDGVNMRPRPSHDVSTDVTNFPLRFKLYAGDRLRAIRRADPSLPIEDTWMRVWSPPGATAWIRAEATEALGAGADGAALWAEALRALAAAHPEPGEDEADPRAGTAAVEAAAKPFEDAIAAAWAVVEEERGKETPDLVRVRAAFEAAGELAATVVQRARVAQGMETLATLEEAAALRVALERERVRLLEEAREREEAIERRVREKDPFGGVFLARGIVERLQGPEDEEPRYVVRFGADVVAEIVCASGKYDLDLFGGRYVGVRGLDLGTTEGPRKIEVTAIEVLPKR